MEKSTDLRAVLEAFAAISRIPRGSYHEDKIADFLVGYARERGLEAEKDDAKNVLVRLRATEGREEEEPFVLQGHTDMVCEAAPGVIHDFEKDPIEPVEKDGFLAANGTTLGADDGFAVALMMTLMDGILPSHPALELLFTATEEAGMDGVKGFDFSKLRGKRLINMDSENEHEIVAGCAGGVRTRFTLEGERERADKALSVEISGLCGGHSGGAIGLGRTNADKLMGRLLLSISETEDFRISSIEGGTKENAIARTSTCLLATEDPKKLAESIAVIGSELSAELPGDDSGFLLTLRQTKVEDAFDKHTTEKITHFLALLPDGVRKTDSETGTVEWSSNIGRLLTEGEHVEIGILSRSAREGQLDESIREWNAYAKLFGAKVEHGERYPGFAYDKNSKLAKDYSDAYEKLYGERPKPTVIHAGLECGIIREKRADMDIISVGPDTMDIHTPDEKLDLASAERFVRTVFAVIG